jgi:hypothetical protein
MAHGAGEAAWALLLAATKNSIPNTLITAAAMRLSHRYAFMRTSKNIERA